MTAFWDFLDGSKMLRVVLFPEYSVMSFCQDRPTPELSFFDLQAEIQKGLPSVAE